ncbi:hypothetical protein EDC96DRAFT_500918 [Choanephora cucurbitarum]|nr:hypothetical protein EDC96DRAFT_500918 [Choanephora cucurbitarum]
MSEPQTRPTEELMSTPDSEHRVADVDSQTTPTPEPTGPLKTLKDAFPDLDLDIIQTILASQDNRLDAAFEVLLGMSDPSYKPEPGQLEGLTQMQQDEAYARQLSREAYGQPTQDNSNRNNEPLFNFQEELPVIKEKVIEAGIAAKNKLVNLYNQFMEGPSELQQQQQQQQTSTRQSNSLEDNMNNLRLSDNQNANVDLYGGEGRMPVRSHYEQPNAQPKNTTSTPKDQLLSDEEFARRLAREDSELDTTPTLSDTRHHEVVNQGKYYCISLKKNHLPIDSISSSPFFRTTKYDSKAC